MSAAVTNLNALWKAREAVEARREKGLAPPASPFLDAVAGYDAPQSYNPPPRKRRKQPTGQEAGIEKSLPNGDQAL